MNRPIQKDEKRCAGFSMGQSRCFFSLRFLSSFIFLFSVLCFLFSGFSYAQDGSVQNQESAAAQAPAAAIQGEAGVEVPAPTPAQTENSLEELVTIARKAKDDGDFAKVYATVDEVMQRFGREAAKEQASLKDFPPTEQINNYATLNNVAQVQFIKGEALKKEGKKDDSIAAFGAIVSDLWLCPGMGPARVVL